MEAGGDAKIGEEASEEGKPAGLALQEGFAASLRSPEAVAPIAIGPRVPAGLRTRA